MSIRAKWTVGVGIALVVVTTAVVGAQTADDGDDRPWIPVEVTIYGIEDWVEGDHLLHIHADCELADPMMAGTTAVIDVVRFRPRGDLAEIHGGVAECSFWHGRLKTLASSWAPDADGNYWAGIPIPAHWAADYGAGRIGLSISEPDPELAPSYRTPVAGRFYIGALKYITHPPFSDDWIPRLAPYPVPVP